MATEAAGGRVDRGFRSGHEGSVSLYERAQEVIAGGVTHDGRYHQPFPVYITHAKGGRKWDVDGNEYVDYVMGHGALLLGHAHPVIVQAVTQQMQKGTHYGASQELEITWAEHIRRLIPSAEKVRFHSSGTEATQMAMRLARAHTGRDRVVKFHYHFHGWHDYVTVGVEDPLEIPTSAGVPEATLSTVTALPADLGRVREELAKGDVAGVILEPAGPASGALPLDASFSRGLRDLCSEHGTVLIFDEVVTGFRWSPGGFQGLHGIMPDLTTLGKIVGGGVPGAATVGRADIMELLEIRDDPAWNRGRRISHPGTYNANPLSAAAGCAMLQHIADGSVHAKVDAMGERLRSEMQNVFDRHDVGAIVYGEGSCWHLSLTGEPAKRGFPGEVGAALMRALATHGMHVMGSIGFVCSEHTDEDIARTLEALDAGLTDVAADGLLPM